MHVYLATIRREQKIMVHSAEKIWNKSNIDIHQM